jgi:hypothetical protein
MYARKKSMLSCNLRRPRAGASVHVHHRSICSQR